MITALRAWGLGRVALTACLAVALIETAATDQFAVPTIPDRLNGWALIPALVAFTLAEPLIDRSPQLTAHATRSPVLIAVTRLGLAATGTALVCGYCLLSPDGEIVARWVAAGVAVGALAVAMLGPWYWVPLLPGSFAWLQHAAGAFPRPTYAMPGTVLVGVIACTCVAYVGATLVRDAIQRRR